MPGPFNTGKPHSGDNWRIPADVASAMLDVTREHRTGNLQPDLAERSAFSDLAVVSVKNMSGQTLPRFSVVGLDVPIFDPSTGDDALDAFKSFTGFQVVVPTVPDYVGYFAILLEPLAAHAIGSAAVSGVVPVRLDVQYAGDQWADIADGVTTTLRTGGSGSAQILWKQGDGGNESVGPLWGIVRLSTARLRSFVARIHATGPSGEADTADQRYWVRAQTIGDATIPLHDYQFHENTADYYWGLATNLLEVGAGTHNLQPGDLVIVTEMTMQNDGMPTVHGFNTATAYVFSRLGGGTDQSLAMSRSGEIVWLPKGADGQVLKTSGGALVWSDAMAPQPLLDGSKHNDTVAATPAAGDIIYAHGTPAKWDHLGIQAAQSILYVSAGNLPAWFPASGVNGWVLKTVGGVLTWAAETSTPQPLLDGTVHNDTANIGPTSQDLIYATGTPAKWTRFPKGTAQNASLSMDAGGNLAWQSFSLLDHSHHSDTSGSGNPPAHGAMIAGSDVLGGGQAWKEVAPAAGDGYPLVSASAETAGVKWLAGGDGVFAVITNMTIVGGMVVHMKVRSLTVVKGIVTIVGDEVAVF